MEPLSFIGCGELTMCEELIPDNEPIFRRVRYGFKEYSIEEDGTCRLSSQAFTDRGFRPSVDRSSLCHASDTQGDGDNGVLALIPGDIRAIHDVVRRDQKGRIEGEYAVDVHSDPLPDNPAHSEIRAHPTIANKRVFRRLQDALVRLAEWEIHPKDLR
jgi:hypothetical protein